MSTPKLFQEIHRHVLGQEDFVSLGPNDYALAQEVADCMLVVITFRECGQSKTIAGHFANRNTVSESHSFHSFHRLYLDKTIMSIQYATNYIYSPTALKIVAEKLVEGTDLDKRKVQAYRIPQYPWTKAYRPLCYYAKSDTFMTVASAECALADKLTTAVESIPYPQNECRLL